MARFAKKLPGLRLARFFLCNQWLGRLVKRLSTGLLPKCVDILREAAGKAAFRARGELKSLDRTCFDDVCQPLLRY
jgi:hypothetical protein